jgi:predicted O-methyltransferase YrrM
MNNAAADQRSHGDASKWKKQFDDFKAWDTPRQRSVQEREARVIVSWLVGLKAPRYDILEIGCGNGLVGKRIIEGLIAAGADFSYCFSDLLPQCLETSRLTLGEAARDPRISFITLDVYEADAVLKKGSQQIIISTGFASAATYRAAVPVVAALLREGGMLIADFVNILSPVVFFARPIELTKQLIATVRGSGSAYHMGHIGIKKFFAQHGLSLVACRSLRLRRNPIMCMFTKSSL